jgi:hypothetical protein
MHKGNIQEGYCSNGRLESFFEFGVEERNFQNILLAFEVFSFFLHSHHSSAYYIPYDFESIAEWLTRKNASEQLL